MNQEIAAIDAVSRAVDRIKRHGRFADFTLTNGIVLKCKPIPPFLLQAVNNEFVIPDPPMVFFEDKGRDEPNPNDPNYIKLCDKIIEANNTAINDLLLAVGTEVTHVPNGYFAPEDDGWIATVEFAAKVTRTELHIDKDDQVKRYLCWLRFYALETGMDAVLATGIVNQLAGITEGEVEEVVDSFRRLPERGTDIESETETGSSNGNSTNRAGRRARS